MSKASEWAKKLADAPKHRLAVVKHECPTLALSDHLATVTEAGDLMIEAGRRHWVILTPADALALVPFILDTFSEER